MPGSSPLTTLRIFCARQIDFVLVGGLAAVLRGAPIQTYDVDVVYSLEEANLARLLLALGELDAIFRMQPSRRLKPNLSHLSGGGHLNFLTTYGPLDLLGFIGKGLQYLDLLPHSTDHTYGRSTLHSSSETGSSYHSEGTAWR